MSKDTEKARAMFEALHAKWKSLQRPISLLLVEDDLLDADHMQRSIGSYSNFTCVARTGSEALDQLEKNEYDLVLLDLRLKSNVEGNDVLRWIKKNRPDLPVFVLTGMDDESKYMKEALALGAKFVIKKPISPDNVQRIFGGLR